MKQIFKSRHVKSLLPYFWLALAVLVVYKIIGEFNTIVTFSGRVWTIVTPFFYGFLLAYILNIPCAAVQRLLSKTKIKFINKKQKALSILIIYLLFLLVLFLVLNLIVPYVYASIATFIANFHTYYQSAQQFINYINGLEILSIDLSLDEIIAQIQDFGIKNLQASFNALTGVSSAIFKGFLAFISSIYILSEKEKFKGFLCRIIQAFSSGPVYDLTLKYFRKLNYSFKQYIYTQTIDGFILGTIATIELYLLGSQYALTLGIILGIVNYVPYFGSIIGSLVAIVIVAFTQGIPAALLTAVILLITQQVDGNIIQPKLMGDSFSLSPLLIIISITVGGAFAGVLGMIAAIPIVAVFKDMLEDILVYFENKKERMD